MRYLDPDGREISESQWRDLYRDTAHQQARQTTRNGHVVTTSWVGLWAETEAKPLPWLVQVRPSSDSKVDKRLRQGKAIWCADRKQALEEHQRRVAALVPPEESA